jgi:hypothetical protein
MGNRLPRQCRERWTFFLSPGHTNPAWTKAEDSRLLDLYAIHGPRWALITHSFPERNESNVKNRWRRITRASADPKALPPDEQTS